MGSEGASFFGVRGTHILHWEDSGTRKQIVGLWAVAHMSAGLLGFCGVTTGEKLACIGGLVC